MFDVLLKKTCCRRKSFSFSNPYLRMELDSKKQQYCEEKLFHVIQIDLFRFDLAKIVFLVLLSIVLPFFCGIFVQKEPPYGSSICF